MRCRSLSGNEEGHQVVDDDTWTPLQARRFREERNTLRGYLVVVILFALVVATLLMAG